MSKKIAFIGATGMLGKPVVKALVQKGFEVTALARDPEKIKGDKPGLKVLKGDLRNSGDIDRLLKGKEIVYLNLSVKQNEKRKEWHSESEGITQILDSARKNNIQRVAYLSSIIMNYQGMNGFNWWVFEMKQNAVKKIKGSGIPYTIFYPSNFMESLSNVYRQGNKMMLAGKSKHPMYFISAADYGKQVAAALSKDNGAGKEYFVQGPQPFTADEAVAEFMRHYKKNKLSVTRAPLGMLKFLGLFITKMDYGAHIIEALNNYPEKFMARETWDELGKPEITIQKYAESFN